MTAHLAPAPSWCPPQGETSCETSRPRSDRDQPLIEAARTGCRWSLGQLLEIFRAPLLLQARRGLNPHLRTKADPADLVQDTLLEAQRDFAHFQGTTVMKLGGWLRRILRNRLIDFARRYHGTDKRQLSLEVSVESLAGSTGAEDVLIVLMPADDDLIRQEEVGELRRRLADLPSHYRQVIHWHGQEGRSFVEIGVMLGRKPDAVRMLYTRALHSLRASLL